MYTAAVRLTSFAQRSLRLPLRFKVLGIATFLGATLGGSFLGIRRELFLPGRTSNGHHVFEQSCLSCHQPFAGVANPKCVACHREGRAEDTHNTETFEDPRWAASLERLDARACRSCHREHQVTAGGATAAVGFCFPCHDDVAQRRASHAGFAPSSCANAGCHNYHDNSVLNVAFLTQHLSEPELLPTAALPKWGGSVRSTATPVPVYPTSVKVRSEVLADWSASAHAREDINCMACHSSAQGAFDNASPTAVCTRCHSFESTTFSSGKHGIRSALNLSALSAPDARLPMRLHQNKPPAHLACATCHDPHSVDTRRAAVEACLTCHDDAHSRAYRSSKHFDTVSAEGMRTSPQSVTCATCHLPRVMHGSGQEARVAVNHNNTAGLKPRDRMARDVCSRCHGLEFSMNSLFEEQLVANNFQGRPSRQLDTLKMIRALTSSQGRRP